MEFVLSSRMRVAIAAAAIITTGAISIGSPQSSSAGEACPEPTTAGAGPDTYDLDAVADASVDAVACNMIGAFIASDSVVITVPEPGVAVEFSIFNDEDGEALLVGVTHEGTLAFDDVLTKPEGEPISACDDAAYNIAKTAGGLGYKMRSGETFYIKAATIPTYLNQSDVISTIDGAMRAWPQQFNDCGMPDQISETVTYGGTSNGESQIQASTDPYGNAISVCDSSKANRESLISFGKAPGTFGATCRWWTLKADNSIDTIISSDIKINDNKTWTLTPNFGSCTDAADLKSVMTHEAGHWWGLGHVDPSAHGKLTMRGGGAAAVVCNDMLRTLGRGDVLGMRALYN